MIEKIKRSLKNIADLAVTRKNHSVSKLDVRTFEEILGIAAKQLQEIAEDERIQRRELLKNEQEVQPTGHVKKPKSATASTTRGKTLSKSGKTNTSGTSRRKSK